MYMIKYFVGDKTMRTSTPQQKERTKRVSKIMAAYSKSVKIATIKREIDKHLGFEFITTQAFSRWRKERNLPQVSTLLPMLSVESDLVKYFALNLLHVVFPENYPVDYTHLIPVPKVPIKKRKPAEERFWSKVEKSSPSECWEWKASRYKHGYGIFWWKKYGEQYAHRVAWILTFGPIPDGICVCHKCDNRGCVNPNHLFLGTVAENIRDRDAKNRQNKGEKMKSAKLSRDDVLKIRELHKAGVRYSELARQFSVTWSTIKSACDYTTWKHVV
jgi:hypothetical protein